jgi:hypothetical protein
MALSPAFWRLRDVPVVGVVYDGPIGPSFDRSMFSAVNFRAAVGRIWRLRHFRKTY